MAKFRTTLRESDLREILRHNSLDLHYQPRVELQSSRIIGMEALVRWPLFESSTLSTGRFLGVTWDQGLLRTMGECLLRQACTQAARWNELGHADLRLALGLSLHQIADRELPTRIAAILEVSGLPAERLELEVTEEMLMQDLEYFPSTLTRLRGLGTHITITGFGTGYSSFSVLRRSLVGTLKIDESFIAGLGLNPDADAIVSAVIAMANNLGLTTLAAGVTTKEQVQFLRREGCDQIQGPFHSQPQPAREFTRTLELYQLLDKTRAVAAQIHARNRQFQA